MRLGGHEQWIMLRGHSTDKPVLLYLSGGPGQSDLPFVRVLLHDLTQNFVVVGWDQRGTGKSYSALDPTETLTLDRAVSDTIELTNYLRVVTHNSGLGGLQHYLTRLRLWRCPVEWYCKTLLKL